MTTKTENSVSNNPNDNRKKWESKKAPTYVSRASNRIIDLWLDVQSDIYPDGRMSEPYLRLNQVSQEIGTGQKTYRDFRIYPKDIECVKAMIKALEKTISENFEIVKIPEETQE